ncbi:allophanate hydrolase subunit 2 family protein [Polaribacter sp. WD7]|uniref:5-oxoprolinase subunit C family protein n=1 Tax=Polaribacter sp. WD7 TaxID=2269061 RepID=UPI000DF2AC8D|nr:biotin-dependent carboxyltransferase family protein [Polaribacter sp. WD7]RCS26398.1 allophanate hydrolase subunit 2 family protein [Polaribacter sp. WD7]
MIKVLKAGFYASIQDKGRVGFSTEGVPISGAMDGYSADIANAVINNSLDAAVLEITFGATELKFLTATAIAISGANFNPTINKKPIRQNSRIEVEKGDILFFGKPNYGVRSYLAVKGGFQTLKILGSRSQFINITDNFKIEPGDILELNTDETKLKSSNSSIKIPKTHFTLKEITCYEGPEFYMLTSLEKEKLFKTTFTISSDNNRMGYRLKENLKNNLPTILTAGVLPGTVQLTPFGNLIVLMRDCQVTGGYPRILQLTESSLDRIAQKTTNQKIRFRTLKGLS